ncbi:MAG: pitrilysin family protein [Candidatus Staskawiczbacteria bacterium]|nr:pitrilysin family protein [Candidatus Staskawiczbacteria bacterium]
MFQKTTLKSGLRLIAVPIKNSNSVTVLILVGTGSKHETKEINGISHFLEHMFFKGTKKRSNTLKIAETLDMVGGEYNAFTSKEITGFWAKVDNKHLDIALDWISDMFLNSKFDQKEMQKEKGVIIEEMNMYLDTPTVYVSELFEKLLYGNQPAGWRIIGEKENILSFNRQKVLDYYKNHYSSSNTVICVAGNIDSGKVKNKVQGYFKNIEVREAKEKIKTTEKQQKPGIMLHLKKTDQTHFCLGVRAYDMFHPQKDALSLLSVILGGNMSSRLFIKVRERQGLAYYIHTSVDATSDTGYLVTQAGIDHKNLEKSLSLILKEYRDLKNNKITAKELQKAKDYLKGMSTLSLEPSNSQASFYASQELLENKILTLEEKFKKIDKVSVSDIKKVAEDIFLPKNLNLAIIGPFGEKEKEKLQRLLKI